MRNVEVEHDVQLPGKSNTSHQIDVYWKFERGGIEYETIVQAKDWNKAVDQGELLKFNGVLSDLPRRMTGVFVSREGSQQGAKDYALANGILIYELREAEPPPGLYMHPGDWANFAFIRLPLRAIITTPGEAVPAGDSLRPRLQHTLLHAGILKPQVRCIQEMAPSRISNYGYRSAHEIRLFARTFTRTKTLRRQRNRDWKRCRSFSEARTESPHPRAC